MSGTHYASLTPSESQLIEDTPVATDTVTPKASPVVWATAVTVHPPASRASSETSLPRVSSDSDTFTPPITTPQSLPDRSPTSLRWSRMLGGRPRELLVRSTSVPVHPSGRRPANPWPHTPEGQEDDYDIYNEECSPGSGHCEPPCEREDDDEASRAGGNSAALGPAIAESDEDADSLGDFVCKTAASIEISWAAVKRAKEERPDWRTSWSF